MKSVVRPLALSSLFIACLLTASCNKAAKVDTAQNTAQVQRGNIRIIVISSGKVVANRDVDIKCRASGEVKYLPYDISDQVKEGDILLQLDTTDEKQAIQRAEASVANSEAQLAQAKQNYLIAKANLITDRLKAEANMLYAQAKQKDAHTKLERQRQLLSLKLASQEDFDTADTTSIQADADLKTAQAGIEALKSEELNLVVKENDIKAAQAELDSNNVNLDIQKQQLKYCTVPAPVNGVISARTIQIGTLIQSSMNNVSGGSAVMTLSDLSHMFVYATVDEADIGRIIVGQDVNISADAFPGIPFKGKVSRIATKGVNTSNIVTFEVRIEVISPNKNLLKPEMTATANIVCAEKENVLLVPNQAVTRKRSGGNTTKPAPTDSTETQPAATEPNKPHHHGDGSPETRSQMATVNIPKPDGTTETISVTLGQDDGTNYEVLSGLSEGQTVILNAVGADSRFRSNDTSKSKGPRPPF